MCFQRAVLSEWWQKMTSYILLYVIFFPRQDLNRETGRHFVSTLYHSMITLHCRHRHHWHHHHSGLFIGIRNSEDISTNVWGGINMHERKFTLKIIKKAEKLHWVVGGRGVVSQLGWVLPLLVGGKNMTVIMSFAAIWLVHMANVK